jgi:prepilin-type N-terminal cleavage/methylation domain-containing protein
MRQRAAGFTLIEVLVSLSIAAILATSAIAVFLTVRLSALEAAARAQMARDGQVALDTLEHDLRFFGAGVPLVENGDIGTTASGQSLLPILRVARDDNLVFLGDLPYPNAELSGLASLAYVGDNGSDAHRIAVTSETSGSCIPPMSSSGMLACRTSQTTLLPGLQSAADCTGATQPVDDNLDADRLLGARTCPWGMNKWLPGAGGIVALTLVDSNGRWHERQNRNGEIGDDPVDNRFLGTHLQHDFPSSNGQDVSRAIFFGNAGGSYVAVMDRVFYAVEQTAAAGTACARTAGGDCALRRRQCWGRLLDPSSAGFPAAGTSSFVGSTTTPAECATGQPISDGTPWETVVSGVESITFRYFGDASVPLLGGGSGVPLSSTQAAQVKALEIELRLRRKIPGTQPARFIDDVLRRRFFLPNQQ